MMDFVTTSNVDGQFQKAGFEESRVLEVHGSIHRLQCSEPCRDTVWSAEFIQPNTDDARCEWVGGFEKLQVVPLLIITPLTFLGGSFYSIAMLPPFWQKVALFNPVVYLISGFRWSFYDIADVSLGVSLGMTVVFLAVALAIVAWIFRTGYRLKK